MKQNPSKLQNNVNLEAEEWTRKLFKILPTILWFYRNKQINVILTNGCSLHVSDWPETGKKSNCILQATWKFWEWNQGNQCNMHQVTEKVYFYDVCKRNYFCSPTLSQKWCLVSIITLRKFLSHKAHSMPFQYFEGDCYWLG